MKPIYENELQMSIESLLKLAIPSCTYIWVIGFYLYFYLVLNLMAELLTFGDRLFYKDWWNAANIGLYWRNCNLPVHNWLIRHKYFPLIRNGISKSNATLLVFIFSGMFHELAVSVPCHTMKWYSFFAMIIQVGI